MSAITAFVVLLAALLAFAWIGFRVRGQPGSVDDYIVARNSQGAGILGLSLLASGMGAWILFAPPEVGAFDGIVPVLGYAIGSGLPFLVFAILGIRLRRLLPSGHSLAEFVRLRFGRTLHAYVVALSILYMLVFVTAELTAAGAITAFLSPLDGRVTIAAVLIITLAYTAYGGLRASLETDRWQAWLLILLLIVTTAAILSASREPMHAVYTSDLLRVDGNGLGIALTLIIAVTTANMFHQGYWQRVWAARDGRALMRGAGIGIVTTFFAVMLVGLLGLLAAAEGLPMGSPPTPFFALLNNAPAWLTLVVLVLTIALVASSVDTLESGLAALVTAELPSISLAGARWITVLLMIPAAIVAIQGYSVLRLFLIADLLCTTAVVPALLGLWKRTTPGAALAGCLAGIVGAIAPGWVTTGSLTNGILLATFPGAVPTLPPFLYALGISTIVTVLLSVVARGAADLEKIGEQVPEMSGGR